MEIPEINFQDITGSHLSLAFDTLEACKVTAVPTYGFVYPFLAPGGGYGAQWWQLDSSLALVGYKWRDIVFAENVIRNFILVQKPDGRIPLFGYDRLPDGPGYAPEPEGNSSLPKIFDSAMGVLLQSGDMDLMNGAYEMFRNYLGWWFRERQDAKTHLVTAVIEETFIAYHGRSGEYAPVDTNMETAIGCACAAEFARILDREDEARDWDRRRTVIQEAVNMYLWDGEKGAYYPYDLRAGKRIGPLMASTFEAMRLNTAPRENVKRLMTLLTDPESFGWGRAALNSVSMKDPRFVVKTGLYQGDACWSGNVWTLLNEGVVRALEDCGEKRAAADLAWQTVRLFDGRFCEYINPKENSAEGVQQYAWSASQWIELLIEHLFGVRCDTVRKTVSVAPLAVYLPLSEPVSMTGLRLPDGSLLDVRMDLQDSDQKVKCEIHGDTVYRILTEI